MEKVLVFLDFANINRAANDKGIKFDYEKVLNYLTENRFLIDAYAYVPKNPRNEHSHDRDIENLWLNGYQVNTKTGTFAGNSFKCDFDIEITMDILNAIHNIKPDTIILMSGDVDFLPVVKEVRKNGIRLEVASFEPSVAREMMFKSSGFISLDSFIETETEEAEPLEMINDE